MNKTDKMAVIFREMLETYEAKNADYGDSFSKSYQEFGLTAPIIRISDKVERLKSLSKADARVKDESIRDTLIDLANYAIMTVVELDAEEAKIKECEDRITERLEKRGKDIDKTKEEAVNSIMQEINRINGLPICIGEKGHLGEPACAVDKNGEPIVPKEIKPGLKTGRYRGYQIYIRHINDVFVSSFPYGYYCGYVVLPFSHPYYGKPSQFIDNLYVHGGLTFYGVLHDISSVKYLLGFDCGHAGDDINVQNEAYTLKECMKLVDQLIEVDAKEYTEGNKLNI